MKAYLFIETGEVRRPKDGEWVIFEDGDFVLNIDDDYIAKYPIVTRHEIEIPEGANNATVAFQRVDGCLRGSISHVEIPIPRPKKKVKKWRWAMATKKGKDVGITNHMTEEELHRYYPNQMWYHRIDETEIEVDE